MMILKLCGFSFNQQRSERPMLPLIGRGKAVRIAIPCNLTQTREGEMMDKYRYLLVCCSC